MTEADWLTWTDPVHLLRFLDGMASDRKSRLYSCAIGRSVRGRHPYARCLRAIDVNERYADGAITAGELTGAGWSADGPSFRLEALALGGRRRGRWPDGVGWTTEDDASPPDLCPSDTEVLRICYPDAPAEAAGLTRSSLDLIRDIFANPFRPVTADPRWLSSAAVGLARAMHEARDFATMPILADALEEAGCDAAAVPGHLRGDGPHVRGCWAADLVLGNE